MINNTVEDDRKTRMGKIGETIFANFCSAKGYKIEVSIDPYDSKKDMIVDRANMILRAKLLHLLALASHYELHM